MMCDDLGYADVGFNGATDIQTPELDQLARNGTVCTSGYVAHPFCGPSRMGLFAGRYPHAFGAPFNLPNTWLGIKEFNQLGIPASETLLSTVLQDAGYFTGVIGKWHMGVDQPFHPNNRGFDEFYGFLGGGHEYFPEKYQPIYERQSRVGKEFYNDYIIPLEHNGKQVKETQYMTDAISRESVSFIHKASGQDSPFFLFVSYNGSLKRGKGSVYEGGCRVPMFFHWPGTVEAGNTYQHPVSALDFFPTFAGLANAKIPTDKTLDGLDIWNDFLQGNNPRPKDPAFVMRHHAEFSNFGVRRGPWKASCVGKRWQLFNLDDDIEEVNDLSQQHPELLNSMRNQAESWARLHPQPAWFDNIKSRDHWMDSNMPNLPAMFPGK